MTTTPGADGRRLPDARSVLAVVAHPDDESFGLGAVLAHLGEQGAEVAVLCFTRGEASTLGVADPSLGDRRGAELAAAATELGVSRVELFDRPDGSLASEPLDQLAAEVASVAEAVGAELLVVFDQGGVTGHPDHGRATEAALAGAPDLPVLAWTLPRPVADDLNAELGTAFVGRGDDEIDLVVAVDRIRQQRAIARHASQSGDNPVLARRLERLGGSEWLRWLRPPGSPTASSTAPGGEPSTRAPLAEVAAEWDRRYAATDRLFRAEPDQTLVEVVGPLAPGRALDLGAGEGRNSLWLAARGWQVTAVDLSRQALGRLAQAAAADGLEVATATDDALAYLASAGRAGAFDLVVLAYVHPVPADRAPVLRAAAAAVAPGGFLFVVGHHHRPHGVGDGFDPARLYGETDLRRAADGLEVLRLEARHGQSDIHEPGTDLVLWARRPPNPRPTPAS